MQATCARLVDSGTVLSYDEAMIRFMGRARNLVLASRKPIKEGYEAMVLATSSHAHGYIYSFYLRGIIGSLDGPAGKVSIADTRLRRSCHLSPTNTIMIHLASDVPRQFRGSTIDCRLALYADNRFLNVTTMAFLRTIGVGGCGTFRSNARGQLADAKQVMRQRRQALTQHVWAI